MERYFYRRGQRVVVSEVEGVLAVQVDAAAHANVSAEAFGQPIDAARGVTFTTDAPSRGACRHSRLPAGSLSSRQAHSPCPRHPHRYRPAEVQDVGQVYQQPDGHILIGSRNLIVQLSPELSDAAPGVN